MAGSTSPTWQTNAQVEALVVVNGVIYAVEEALDFAEDADEDHEACSRAIDKFNWARNLTKSNSHLWRDLELPTVAGPGEPSK